VSPGSGDNAIDNRGDVKAWAMALNSTGRDIWFEISWHLNINYATWWKQYTNGWRIEDDVDCYCDTLVTWDSVQKRFLDVQQWNGYAGPGGWNDFDSLNVGNGKIGGLTDTERQTVASLWAISCAPLYTGNDLTDLDSYGILLLTNKEIIMVNQRGIPARLTSSSSGNLLQVWTINNKDGSHVVALFNLASSSATVVAHWSDLGFSGNATVHDLWLLSDVGTYDGYFSSVLLSHGSRVIQVVPVV